MRSLAQWRYWALLNVCDLSQDTDYLLDRVEILGIFLNAMPNREADGMCIARVMRSVGNHSELGTVELVVKTAALCAIVDPAWKVSSDSAGTILGKLDGADMAAEEEWLDDFAIRKGDPERSAPSHPAPAELGPDALIAHETTAETGRGGPSL